MLYRQVSFIPFYLDNDKKSYILIIQGIKSFVISNFCKLFRVSGTTASPGGTVTQVYFDIGYDIKFCSYLKNNR